VGVDQERNKLKLVRLRVAGEGLHSNSSPMKNLLVLVRLMLQPDCWKKLDYHIHRMVKDKFWEVHCFAQVLLFEQT
jgi:hypothetical protein